MAIPTACSFCSVAVVAWLASIAVLVLSLYVDKGTVQLRVTPSYAVVDCAPPPPPSSAARNSSAFRESLLPLLAALPAAAAPRGFASLPSKDHSVFVRGICHGFNNLTDSCHACLAAAAENLTSSCLGASRRGGAWRSEGCFVAYADTNTSSAREDAFRDVVFSGQDPRGDPNCFDTRKLVALARSMARRRATKVLGAHVIRDAADLARRSVVATAKKNTVRVFPDVARGDTRVRVLAQCARDRAPECARCLGDAARQVPPCAWGLDGAHVRAADVVGYGCYLRVETLVKPLRVVTWRSEFLDMAFNVLLALELFALTLAAVAACVLQD